MSTKSRYHAVFLGLQAWSRVRASGFVVLQNEGASGRDRLAVDVIMRCAVEPDVVVAGDLGDGFRADMAGYDIKLEALALIVRRHGREVFLGGSDALQVACVFVYPRMAEHLVELRFVIIRKVADPAQDIWMVSLHGFDRE